MSQNMGNRMVEIRKIKGLTQNQFAEAIGCSRSAISTYEAGRNEPIGPVIQAIVREFNVDEIWLRTGEGSPFRATSRNEQIAAFAGDIMRDEPESFRKAFVAALAELSLEDWKVLERLARATVEKAENAGK